MDSANWSCLPKSTTFSLNALIMCDLCGWASPSGPAHRANARDISYWGSSPGDSPSHLYIQDIPFFYQHPFICFSFLLFSPFLSFSFSLLLCRHSPNWCSHGTGRLMSVIKFPKEGWMWIVTGCFNTTLCVPLWARKRRLRSRTRRSLKRACATAMAGALPQ